MESIGKKLKAVREEKGFSLDQVARDTHIAKRFLVALEDEDFAAFPGDTYVIGFIRNYSEYLGLDSVELVSLYKNLKIQEQPVPMDELFEKKTDKKYFIAAGAVVLAILLGIGIFFLVRTVSSSSGDDRKSQAQNRKYQFKEEILEQSFMQGDEILVVRNSDTYAVRVDNIGNAVVVVGPLGKLSLKQGEEGILELTKNGETVRILCRTVQKNEKPPRVILRLDRYSQAPGGESAGGSSGESSLATGSSPSIGSTNEVSRQRRPQVILESVGRAPFSMEIEFRGYCLFRYMTESQEREERYFRKGETFRTDVRNEIRLWYSNSGSMLARISGKEIEFGKPGEVGAALIKWVRNDRTGGYRLELVPVY